VTAPTSTSSNAAKLNNDLVSEGAASSSSSDDDVQKLLNYAPIVLGLLFTSTDARSTVHRPLHIPSTQSQAGGAYHDTEHDFHDDEPMPD
jgi:hypothetical protein